MKDIVIVSTSRSERALQQPLISKFGERCEVLEVPSDFRGAYDAVQNYLMSKHIYDEEQTLLASVGLPDVAFCSFDRPEMLGAALAFYFNKIPIVQYHAGDAGVGKGNFDDDIRNMITLMSTFQFCNGRKSYERCIEFLKSAKKDTSKCCEVGSMAIEGVKLDYSIVPEEKFDLVLYNTPAADLSLIDGELSQIEKLLNKYTIWVFPNEDFGRDCVIATIKKLEDEKLVHGCKTLPRNQFLALTKEADRVIGNSSSFKLELPFYRKGYIHVGVRNKDREAIEPGIGASDKMVEIITRWLDEKKKE